MYYSSSDDSDEQVTERKLVFPIKRHNQQESTRDHSRDLFVSTDHDKTDDSAEFELTDLLSGLDLKLKKDNVKEEEWGYLENDINKKTELDEGEDIENSEEKSVRNRGTYVEKNPTFSLDGKESEKRRVKRLVDNKDNTRYLIRPQKENIIINIHENKAVKEKIQETVIVLKELSPLDKQNAGDVSFVIWLMMVLEGEYPYQILEKFMDSDPVRKLSKRQLVQLGVRLIARMQKD